MTGDGGEAGTLNQYRLTDPAQLLYVNVDGDGTRPRPPARTPGRFLYACDLLATLSRSKARIGQLVRNWHASPDPLHLAAVVRSYVHQWQRHDAWLTEAADLWNQGAAFTLSVEEELGLTPSVAADIDTRRARAAGGPP